MQLYKNVVDGKEEIIVESKNQKFVIGWYGSDLYWIMLDYLPNNKFTITKDVPCLFDFLDKLFTAEYFKNNTFIWLSEARIPKNSSSLKITKGKNHFRIRFIQGENDILAKAKHICPICFCLSGSRNQRIADKFSLLLHELLNRDLY